MFRRRRITPSISPLRATFEEQLARAQVLYQQKRYAAAAAIFEELAGLAESRGGQRAPRFYLQAGRAWLHAGNAIRGMPLLEYGWNLALQTGRQTLLARMGPTLVTELVDLGLGQHSRTVAAWLSTIKEMAGKPAGNSSQRPQLPLKCPSCGATVNPSRVDWLDESTAECDFCGSALRGS